MHIVKGYSLSLCWWSYHWHNKETRRAHDTSLWYSTAYVSQIEFCTINITDCFLPHKYDAIKKTNKQKYHIGLNYLMLDIAIVWSLLQKNMMVDGVEGL
jgi:hypothetical protein